MKDDYSNTKKSFDDYKGLLPIIKEWLGREGLSFFREIKEKYGKVNACLEINGIPWPVHMREGMQVRNKLRVLTDNSWTVYEYDNTWSDVIEASLSL